jgi:hypothetical protein
LGIGLGASALSNWIQHPKILLVACFLPNNHTALGPELLVIYMSLTSCFFVTSYRATQNTQHQLQFLQG